MTLTGLLLIAAALILSAYNIWENHQSGAYSEQVLQEIMDTMDSSEGFSEADTQTGGEQEDTPDVEIDPDVEMPSAEIDGHTYIGTLEVPTLALSLPVMSDWSDSNLKLAPCRYSGSVYSNDLIIAGHNYKKHFGGLHNLAVGDEVIFTDMAGNRFAYTVSQVEQLPGAAIEEMESGEWNLTIFTCTIGGKARVTVRCVLGE